MALFKNVFNRTSNEPENPRCNGATCTSAPLAQSAQSAERTRPATDSHTERRTYAFRECLNGTASVPRDPAGKGLFQILMAGGMVTFMATFNGVIHSDASVLDFIASSHWIYPLIMCISLGIRFLFANRLVDYLAPRFILPRFTGFARNVAMTLTNVAIMAPIMGCVMTMLLNGPEGFFARLVATMPLSALVAILVNLLIVGPLVKMLYHNVLTPAAGSKVFQITQRYVTNWAGMITF